MMRLKGVLDFIRPEFMAMFLVSTLAVGCATLLPMVKDAVLGSASKGGINTELVVGDKEQVLGTNLEVDAKHVGKVVGMSDNSVIATNAKEVQITNNTIPLWIIGLLITLAGLVGWLAPRPALWKRAIQRKLT